MNIHQLSVNYVDEHDRILVRFNTSDGDELRLWLTRRMVSRVWEPLQEAVGHLEANKNNLSDRSETSRRLLTDLKRAEVLQQSDFATPFKNASVKLPLGSEPLVVTQMDMTVHDHHHLQIGFEERLPQQQEVRGFKVAMESAMLHGFMHLLESAVAKAQWELVSAASQVDNAFSDDSGVQTRPKYLQ
jgi:hypothetical protein